ncbi:MAG: hypothetical protein ACLP05_07520 [Candidatus Kryptoniota bacterium]
MGKVRDLKHGSCYVGPTKYRAKSLPEHNGGHDRSTEFHESYEALHAYELDSRTFPIRRESCLKSARVWLDVRAFEGVGARSHNGSLRDKSPHPENAEAGIGETNELRCRVSDPRSGYPICKV